MEYEIILTVLAAVFALGIIGAFACIYFINAKQKIIVRNQNHQQALLVKIHSAMKSKSAMNAVAENAEIIYQDLLQHITPLLAATDVKPRESSEHALWRALGGLMDEYARNPFVLENLRRLIKLDSNIARNASLYISRADALLRGLDSAEPNGALSAAFADGLLGQAMTLLSQAKQLANG